MHIIMTLLAFAEMNDLKCIVRSHAEIRAGCGLSHEGCYTVFSAPNKSRGILGGVVVIDQAKGLEIQGNVFTDCDFEEAISLVAQAQNQKHPEQETHNE